MGSISCHGNQSLYPIKTNKKKNKKKKQLFFPPICRWRMCNMRTIGPAVSEKIFEIVNDGRTDDGRRTDVEAWVYYKNVRQLGPKTTRTRNLWDDSDPKLFGPKTNRTQTFSYPRRIGPLLTGDIRTRS